MSQNTAEIPTHIS